MAPQLRCMPASDKIELRKAVNVANTMDTFTAFLDCTITCNVI